jgi:hypothetical protein
VLVVFIKGIEYEKVTYDMWVVNNETALAASDFDR